ncbi:MAG: leucine-rich repeat protein [Proteobacteria bacterium]|nr:leucine-rich repeat protein [Pseudomonadota bacterium]
MQVSSQPCIIFTEDVIEEYALEHWDTNHDKCIGYEEADAVTEIPDNAFKGKTDFSSIADLKQFKNIIKIGESAFEDCHIYDAIDLPNVKTIEKKAFMISRELSL